MDGAKPRCAGLEGFSLHANVAVPAHARERLEHLCRYLLRSPGHSVSKVVRTFPGPGVRPRLPPAGVRAPAAFGFPQGG